MFIKSLLKSYVCMVDWADVLAPCPISVVPYVVLTGKVSEDAKDKVIDVLRKHHIPFTLLGDVLGLQSFSKEPRITVVRAPSTPSTQ